MARANYELPVKTLNTVKSMAHAPTKRQAIIIALEEYIRRKKVERLIASRGKIPLRWTRSSLKKYRA